LHARSDSAIESGGDIVHRDITVLCVALLAATPLAQLRGDGAARCDAPRPALSRGDATDAPRPIEENPGHPSDSPETSVLLARLYRSRATITDRLRAQEILECGLRRYPDHPGLLEELGITLYSRTLYGDAERVFRQLLEIDPRRCGARYYLGISAYRKWKHVQSYTEYLRDAARDLRAALDCGFEEEDAYFKLAFSRWALGDTTGALQTCTAYRAAYPTASEPLFLAGSIAYASGRTEVCRDRFDEALSLLKGDERAIYTDLSHLLSDGIGKDAYASAPASDRAETERLYWIAHDPDPTTEINERLLEHVYRVFVSGVRFASAAPPIDGWDTPRGRAFVKFGEPDHVETTLAGLRPMDGRAEIWTYLDTAQPFVLFFRDEYLNGNYIVPIEDVISSATLREDPPLTSHVPAAANVPGSLEALAFRESETEARVYLVHAADADSLDKLLRTWSVERFRRRTAVYLADGRPHGFHTGDLAADSLAECAASSPRLYTAAQEISLPFGAYRAAACLEDEQGVARSVAWSDIEAARFIGGSLVTSDLALCSRTCAEGPLILRDGRPLRVNPGARYPAGESLVAYLEAYNLTIRNGRSRYDLSYTIRRAQAPGGIWGALKRGAQRIGLAGSLPPPAISHTFERVGTSETSAEEIAVDIGALDPGIYELTVTVIDGASGESVSVERRFVKAGDERSGKE
jgi:GWxTD domain-containing protein